METIKSFLGRSDICAEKGCEKLRIDKDHKVCVNHFHAQKTGCCLKHTCVVCGGFSTSNMVYMSFEEVRVGNISGDRRIYKNRDMFQICWECSRHLRCRDKSDELECNNLVVSDLSVKISTMYYVFGKNSVNMHITSKDGKIKSNYCDEHKCYKGSEGNLEYCHKEKNCPFHSCGLKECNKQPNQTGYCAEHSNS